MSRRALLQHSLGRARWVLLGGAAALVMAALSGRLPLTAALTQPTDREAIRELSMSWAARWPDAPIMTEHDRRSVVDALIHGDDARAVAGLTHALALDPNDLDALLMLTMASHTSAEGALTEPQNNEVLEVIQFLEPGQPLLPVAHAWAHLEFDPSESLALLGEAPVEPLGMLVQLRALLTLRADATAAAESLLSLVPGHQQACEVATRGRLMAAESARALSIAVACSSAGADGVVLQRLRADALDRTGLFEEAASAYRDAGAMTHAAAVLMQDGVASDSEILSMLSGDTPDAVLHRLWMGLLRDQPAQVRATVSELNRLGVSGLEFSVGVAASAIAQGDPDAALQVLEGIDAPQAHVLRARAHLQAGDMSAALSSVDEAFAMIPWHPRVKLLRVHVLRQVGAADADRLLADMLSQHPIEREAYSWFRQRDMPWAALIPMGLLPAEGHDLLHSQLAVLLRSGDGPEDSSDLVRGVLEAQDLLRAGAVEDAVAGLEALGRRYPEAVGVQRLMVEARRR